jgi:aminoglycoside phosphotransferase (APT) family kinase protein
MSADLIAAIFAHHGVSDPWQPLPATGLANTIYATEHVVLRVATDHPDAIPDARTESVAAPVARAAGLPTPRLLAFDDTRSIVDRPYSLWERVHAETLGVFAPRPSSVPRTWRAVGRALATLHVVVTSCPDPRGWLDTPERELDLEPRVAALAASGLEAAIVRELEGLLAALRPALRPAASRFLHYDMHDMNVMCERDGTLRAIIDWGDAGWGDPVLECSQVPLEVLPFFLEGYREVAPTFLGDAPEARIIWDKLLYLIEDLETSATPSVRLADLLAYRRETEHRWR